MIKNLLSIIGISLVMLASMPVNANVIVKSEQLNPASPTWSFKTIPGPSKSDIASNAKVTLVGNTFDPASGDGSVLVDGRLTNNPLNLSEEAFLPNANPAGGSIVIDLGQIHPSPPCAAIRGTRILPIRGLAPRRSTRFMPAQRTIRTRRILHRGPRSPTWTHAPIKPASDGTASMVSLSATAPASSATLLRFAGGAAYTIAVAGGCGLTHTMFDEIDVHTKETLAHAGDAVIVRPVKVTDVWVAFKTHFDIGYTDTVPNILHKFRVTMMDVALRDFEANRNLPRKSGFPGSCPAGCCHTFWAPSKTRRGE